MTNKKPYWEDRLPKFGRFIFATYFFIIDAICFIIWFALPLFIFLFGGVGLTELTGNRNYVLYGAVVGVILWAIWLDYWEYKGKPLL